MYFNSLKTVLLLASLSGLLLFIGGVLGGTSGMTIALIMSLVMNGIAYFYSDKIVLKMYGAQPLNQQTHGNIYRIIEELARDMQIPMPKVYLVNTPMANAFATGRNPQHASVAVTTGILSLLDDRELRGVLAHELSHVKNRDILVSSVAATIATAIGYLASIMRFQAMFGSNNRDQNNRTNPLFTLVVALIMPIAASIIQLAISRSREYLADESGAECCKDPLALAQALEKLQTNIPKAHLRQDDTVRATTAPLFIVHPFSAEGIAQLFSTHPPMAQRIARLKAMAQKMNR